MQSTPPTSTPLDPALSDRIARVQERIREAAVRSGRTAADVTLVAVSKTVPVADIAAAYGAGLRVFGESRLQEALPKVATLGGGHVANDPSPSPLHGHAPAWHLIGHLQRNKAARAVGPFQLIHTVDSVALATRLNQAAAVLDIIQPVLIQINIAAEPQKYGIPPEAAAALAAQVADMPQLALHGIMGIPPRPAPGEDTGAAARPWFDALRQRFEEIRATVATPARFHVLSMGMSADFEAAIAEGSTMVRVGSALFGARGGR